MSAPIITLTTDFGQGSPYVAQLKGVLLSALPIPGLQIIDISHELPAHDRRATELLLRSTAWAFPLGTVHLLVVDPGVGSKRRALAARSHGMFFVGPDNGILARPIRADPQAEVVQLDRSAHFRHPLSSTFHGRDLFAPIAAELAAGVDLQTLGSPLPADDIQPSLLPEPERAGPHWLGHVLGADRFGNLTSNLHHTAIDLSAPVVLVRSDDERSALDDNVVVHTTYADADPDDAPFALVGSDGYLELARREGSAATALAPTDSLRIRVAIKGHVADPHQDSDLSPAGRE